MLDDLDSAYARTVESGVDLDQPRDCHLYRIFTWDHAAYLRGQRVRRLGYIGESGRMPLDRLLEHLRDQPWGDILAGTDVDNQRYGCKREVLAAEQAAVVMEKPLYNVEWNKGNPGRVPPWQAVSERNQRNAMRRQPEWVPPKPRARPASLAASAPRVAKATPAPRAAPARRSPTLRRNRWPWRLGGWLILSLLTWAVAVWQLPFSAHLLLLPATAGAAAPLVGSCPSWRGRAGWRKRTCKRVGGVLCAVAVVAFLYAAGAHLST